jgi:hypothetical protein
MGDAGDELMAQINYRHDRPDVPTPRCPVCTTSLEIHQIGGSPDLTMYSCINEKCRVWPGFVAHPLWIPRSL